MENLDNGSLARDEADLILDEMDQEITAVAAKMADLEIDLRRQEVFDIVEARINENQAVDIYDVARAGEVSPGVLNGVDKIQGSENQVAAANNALSKGAASPLRVIIGILMMIAGVGLMIWSFVRQKKDSELFREALQKASDDIKKNPLGIRIVPADPATGVDVRKYYSQLEKDPECVKIFDALKKVYLRIMKKPMTLDINEFYAKPINLFETGRADEETNKVTSSIFWEQTAAADIAELKAYLEKLTLQLKAGTSDIGKYIEKYAAALEKGEALPKELDIDIGAMFKLSSLNGPSEIPYSLKTKFTEDIQRLFPLEYPSGELSTSAQTDLLVRRSGFLKTIKVRSSDMVDNALKSVEVGLGIGAEAAKTNAEMSEEITKLTNKLKTLKLDGKQLDKLDGMSRGDYRVVKNKLEALLKDIGVIEQTISKAILSTISYAQMTGTVVINLRDYAEYWDKLVNAAKIYASSNAGSDGAKKAEGLNDYRENDYYFDDFQNAISDNVIDEVDVNAIADREQDKQQRLQAIHDRVKETGLISRADIKEAEEIEPSLLSDLPERPVFTFQPSTVGYEAGLNSIGEKLKGFGIFVVFLFGIAAILLTVLAVIGKLASRSKGASAKLDEGTKKAMDATIEKTVKEALGMYEEALNDPKNAPTPSSPKKSMFDNNSQAQAAFSKLKNTWQLVRGEDDFNYPTIESWYDAKMPDPWQAKRTDKLDQLRSDVFFDTMVDDYSDTVKEFQQEADELLKKLEVTITAVTNHINNTLHAIKSNDMDRYFPRLIQQVKTRDAGADAKELEEFKNLNERLAKSFIIMFPLSMKDAKIINLVPVSVRTPIIANATRHAAKAFPEDFIRSKLSTNEALKTDTRFLQTLNKIATLEKEASAKIKSEVDTNVIRNLDSDAFEAVSAKNRSLKATLTEIATTQKLLVDFTAHSLKRANAYCQFIDHYNQWNAETVQLSASLSGDSK